MRNGVDAEIPHVGMATWKFRDLEAKREVRGLVQAKGTG